MRPIEWVYIPCFTHPDVSGVTFGGFLVSRYLASQPDAYNAANGDKPHVADGAAPGNVPAFSLPGKPAWRYISYWNARKAAANANAIDGPGVHLLTAFEWASLALLSHKYNCLPHGNNANTNPPADVSYTAETALLDRACYARSSSWYASLTGTGPATWNLLHHPLGVADLNGNMWEWVMGLHMQTAAESGHEGHAMVLASTEVSLALAPYGVSTSVGSSTLTDTNKAWPTDYFTPAGGAGVTCYLIDANGNQLTITGNSSNTITVSGGNPAAGPYEIVVDTGTDITAGMTSGNRILTLRNPDSWLKGYAVPASSDGKGAARYGNDGYWFNTTSPGSPPNHIRAALRGGYWVDGSGAGVFALNLGCPPSYANVNIGFRLGKAL